MRSLQAQESHTVLQTKSQSVVQNDFDLKFGSRPAAPELLIHLHIAKTGGMSLSSLVKHGFKSDEIFESTRDGLETYSGLGVVPFDCCLQGLSRFNMERIRYVSGHVPFGLHRAFGRPAKYMTLIRHPVDRVISYFFYRIQNNDPYLEDGKVLGFEDYVESRRDVHLYDYQVRVVSGRPDLDVEAPARGAQISGAPVERRHLDEAKRNIDEHFLAAAPLEQATELALLVRRIYGWPMRRLQTEYKNPTMERPRLRDIPQHLIRIIEECNPHDLELHEWVGKRFAAQRQLFEPELSRDRRIFGSVNRVLNAVGGILPWSVRKRLAKSLFYAK